MLLPRQCPVERSHQLFQCRQIQCGTSSTISAADHTQDDAYRILEVAVPTRIAVVASFFSAHRPSFVVPILQDGRGQRAAASGLADSTATCLASITEGEIWTACPGITWSDRNRGNVRDITREVAIIRTSSGRARRISSPFRPDTTLHARRAPQHLGLAGRPAGGVRPLARRGRSGQLLVGARRGLRRRAPCRRPSRAAERRRGGKAAGRRAGQA